MKHSKPIKVLTLLCFIFFISSFVLYRGGYFEHKTQGALQGSHNGGSIITKDSLYQKRKDSLKYLIMSSSKSIIIDDAKFDSLVDKRLQKIIKAEREKKAEEQPAMMPSSKSMIFREQKAKISDKPLTNPDTIRPFTTEN